jgi:hypothetical protein
MYLVTRNLNNGDIAVLGKHEHENEAIEDARKSIGPRDTAPIYVWKLIGHQEPKQIVEWVQSEQELET